MKFSLSPIPTVDKGRRLAHVFQGLEEPALDWLMIDSTTVRAHQHAVGQKKRPRQRVLSGPLERMDVFSGEVVGWRVDDNREDALVVVPLRSALQSRQPLTEA